MSSDLLREFGDAQGNPWSHVLGKPVASEQGNDEDDFGDFERPESPKGTQVGLRYSSGNRPCLSGFESTVSKEHAEISKQSRDASTEQIETPSNDDNDWGDFNGTTVLFDAERLNADRSSPWKKSHVHQNRNNDSLAEKPSKVSLLPIASREAITRKVKHLRVKPPPEPHDFDQAENWESVIAGQEPMLPASAITPAAPSTIPEVEVKLDSTVQAKDMGPPPSNIPPPSVLLSLVANLFQSLPGKVRNIVTQDRVSSDPNEALNQPQIDQIKAALSSTRAAARIVAGRRLRWKRDNVLSQSMKIGPAGKSGGMKLTGVDKTESRREDQETAEALSTWRKQVGPLRNTISIANAHLPGSGLAVPEISENMPIRAVKPSEGAVTAPKCCFLCGIKREERVAKVDVNVEDSFGEFWTAHWGHVECVAFWENHKHSLPHR